MRQLAIALTLLFIPSWVVAQETGTITRGSILREQASRQSAVLDHLVRGDLVTLLPETENSYRHVETAEGKTGWVVVRNLRLNITNTGTLSLLAHTPLLADRIDPSWEKPSPNRTQMTNQKGLCGPTGQDVDTVTNARKNRTDKPASVHAVAWKAIGDPSRLPYFLHEPLSREQWTDQDAIDGVAKYEGIALSTTGFIAVIRPQNSGKGESTNCYAKAATETDWHIAITESFGAGEANSIVVETTPRVRRTHHWNLKTLREWEQAEAPVRITGWLLYDPDHPNHLHTHRVTLWEIHPITKIEVWQDNNWVDLDDLP